MVVYIGGDTGDLSSAQDVRAGSYRQRLGVWWRACLAAETDRGFLWLPVLICGGLIAYFSLSFEPSAVVVGIVSGSAFVTSSLLVWRGRMAVAILIAATAFGFALGKFRTMVVDTPVLTADTRTVTLSGWVEAVSFRSAKQQRITLRVTGLEPAPQAKSPRRLRISLSRVNGDLLPGWHVSFKARLFKPRLPVAPGAFDFARRDWFAGLGGTGFGFGEIVIDRANAQTPFRLRMAGHLAEFRNALASTVRQRVEGPPGAFLVAVLTGMRGELPEDSVEHLRASGLAHLLAISGLHMGLVAFTLFGLLRALLALSTRLALRWPIKKWSAVLALFGAAGYLALSGASVSTQRAFIMVAIMFLAIVLERPAISMRNVALAALVILLMQPESVLNVSFQMSFLAVIGLVALYEHRSALNGSTQTGSPTDGHVVAVARRLVFYFVSVLLTTIVASLATAPVAAYQFNRMAAFGIVSNMVAVPVMGTLIMPFAMIGCLLMPLGLDGVPLAIAGWGVSVVLATAEWAAELPFGQHHVSAFEGHVLVVIVAGMLWICLWKSAIRWLGLGGIALGLCLSLSVQRPDILIDGEGRLIAVRTPTGKFALSNSKRGKFTAERWLAADGDNATLEEAAEREGIQCDDEACVAASRGSRTVALLFSPSALKEECAASVVVIATFPVSGDCRSDAVLIDRFSLYRHGAHAVFFTDSQVVVRTVAQWRGLRPWTQAPRDKVSSGE